MSSNPPVATAAAQSDQSEDKTFASFLESVPPNVQTVVSDVYVGELYARGKSWKLNRTDIELHCDTEKCGGILTFRCTDGDKYIHEGWNFEFVSYQCRNCQKTQRTFALAVFRAGSSNEEKGIALKLGETPPFGPHTPARVITLIGPDRDLFLKGRRAENAGLGIGAFAYYRRVVENQKGRIIGEAGRVAKRLGASDATLKQFEKAEKETQFTNAIEVVRDAIPESLLVSGHNPLVLLHSALSEGLHELEDKTCLELAKSVRIVLTDLAERISIALEEKQELDTAVRRLLNKGAKQKSPGS